MRIERVKTTNWCQLQDLDEDYSSASLIGVIGSNGTGKSNLLEAIKFLLTGETHDKLQEYVQYGKKKATLFMVFTDDTTVVEITRTITAEGKATAKIRVQDEKYQINEDEEGVSTVNSMLESLLSIDRDLAKNNIFVRQKHLDDILFTSPAKRERAWQRLCGLGDAEKIHTYLGNVLSDIPECADYTNQILECKANITKLDDKMDAAAIRKCELTDEQATVGYPTAILGVQQKLRDCATARRLLPDATATANNSETTLVAARATLSAEQEKMNELTSEFGSDPAAAITALKEQVDTVDNIVRTMDQAAGIRSTLEQNAEEISRMKTQLLNLQGEDLTAIKDGVDAIEQGLQKLNAKSAEASAHYNMYMSLKNALNESTTQDAECPLCGSVIQSKTWLIERLSGMMLSYNNTVTSLRAEIGEEEGLRQQGSAILLKQDNDIANLTANVNAMEQNYQQMAQNLADMDTDKYDRDHLNTVRTDLVKKQGEVLNLRTTLGTAGATVNTLQLSHEQNVREVERLTAGANAYEATIDVEAQGVALDTVYKRAVEIEAELQEIVGANKSDEDSIANWRQSLTNMEQATATGDADSRVRESLTRIRDWFHYSRGPHKVTMAVLEELTGGVNEFLTTLDGRFYVVSDSENLMFRVVFTDGREQPEDPMPATRLSGGEKASLATAFRLASYYMFSGQLGLICLDEPTEYLDARKIAAFGRFVEQLKEISSSLGLQIFMATHRENIIPLFDAVTRMG